MRPNIAERGWHAILTITLGVAVFVFWRFAHPEALSCSEELQLFLFSKGYLTERLTYPGGPSVYIGEFLTQFFNPLTLGATIMAALFMGIQLMTWRVMKTGMGNKDGKGTGLVYALSLVPAAVLLILMGDENILLTYCVEILIGLAACTCYGRLMKRLWSHMAFLLIGLPVLFYVAGPAAYMLLAYALTRRVVSLNSMGKADLALVVAVIETVLAVVIGYRLSAYPLERVALGIGIYRMAAAPVMPTVMIAILGFIVAMAGWRGANIAHGEVVTVAATVIACAVGTRMSYDEFKYRVMKYDMCLRTRDWSRAIKMGEKSEAKSPLELATINFALAMRGELAERMFEFKQVNSEGLLPVFGREVFTTMMTGDIYFELGMVNTAQRFAFEAQESIPNQQKSGRLTRRLAEVAIVDGKYELAKRYLGVLEMTFAYRQWAKETRKLIADEAKVNSHPLYGKLRRERVTEDFFYSDRELDQMLGLLFNHDKTNRLAVEYLLACELLTRDLPAFARYVPLLGQLPDGGGIRIPRAYQEALCMAWAQKHTSFEGMPWRIDPSIKSLFMDFARIHSANNKDPRLSEGRLGSSYWSYFVNQQ